MELLEFFLVGILIVSLWYQTQYSKWYSATPNKDKIINYLNSNLVGGLNLLDLFWILDTYDLLNLQFPYEQQTKQYLDSIYTENNGWSGPTGTGRALMYYTRHNYTIPPLDGFFGKYDTWEEAINWVQTNQPQNHWGGLWYLVTSWVVQHQTLPWEAELLQALNDYFNVWSNQVHQSTHVFSMLWQLRKFPNPKVDEMAYNLVKLQYDNGSWDDITAETVFAVQTLRYLILFVSNSTLVATMNQSITKGYEFVRSMYVQKESFGAFKTASHQNPSLWATALGTYLIFAPNSDIWMRWVVK